MGRELAATLVRHELAACTVTLKLRYSDFTTLTRSRTLALPVADGPTIALCARELLGRTEAGRRPVRLIGVGASNLMAGALAQLPLFAGP
jgi:DNA polymerase-4